MSLIRQISFMAWSLKGRGEMILVGARLGKDWSSAS